MARRKLPLKMPRTGAAAVEVKRGKETLLGACVYVFGVGFRVCVCEDFERGKSITAATVKIGGRTGWRDAAGG